MLGETTAQASPQQVDTVRRGTFLRLMEEYEPALRRLAAVYVDQHADREDLFQEIAVGLWQAIPRFRGDASERSWLYRIAHNVAISASTKVRRRGKTEETIPQGIDYPSRTPTSEQELLVAEKRVLLLEGIRSLSALDRQVVLLHLEGLNYAQIEEISGITQSAIASRLTRLREKLREEVQAGREKR